MGTNRKSKGLGFLGGSTDKESTCKSGDPSSIPGLERSPEEGKGYPLQYPGLENCMDCIVHGVAKSRTRLSNFHFHINIYQIDDPTTEKQREVYQTHCNLLYMKNNQKENRLMPMYS